VIGELGERNSVLTVRGNGQGIRTGNQVSSEHVQLMGYNGEVGSVWEWRMELIGIAPIALGAEVIVDCLMPGARTVDCISVAIGASGRESLRRNH